MPTARVGGAIAADEAAEDLTAHARRNARTVVGDLDHRLLTLLPQMQLDRAGGRRVLGSVVEQVEDHAVQFVGVASNVERDLVLDRSSCSASVGAISTAALPATSARSQRWWRPTRPASARARSSRSETSRLIRREERSAESTIARSSSCAGLAQRCLEQFEVGEHTGQRGAQLMRGVGDELALFLHRGLALAPGGVE